MEGSGEQVERVNQECLSILDDSFADLSIEAEVSLTTAATPLRELCHDLIEPAATIRWLVRVAAIESGQAQRNRLDAIAVAAAQIAAICEDVLDWPQGGTAARLDVLAGDAAASAHVRYAGVIDVVSQPVTALVPAGDIVRILGNVLANACRAAGPAGRVRVLVDEADGQARLAIADSGSGLGPAAASGRAGLGLGIVSALALKHGGSVHLGVSDLGGLAVTVLLPAQGGPSN
jgi:two-component system OmpR family sensor kinase